MPDLISVNVTTYNRANLLPRCINSILAQDYSPIEVIIVNDGSSDNTEEILNTYKAIDNRVFIMQHNKNQGNAAARNTALSMSKGKYIAFMDDDDEWIDLKKLSKQVKIFENSNDSSLGIVCSNILIENDKKEITKKKVGQPTDIRRFILKMNNIYSPTVLTKRSILLQAGGFDIKLNRGVDSDFYRNCILSLKKHVYYLDEYTTKVYIHSGPRMSPNLSIKSKVIVIKSNLYVLQKYFPFFVRYPSAALFRFKIILGSILVVLKLFFLQKPVR